MIIKATGVSTPSIERVHVPLGILGSQCETDWNDEEFDLQLLLIVLSLNALNLTTAGH